LIPPSPQTIQGERIFDALKNLVHQTTRNQALHIDNDGTFRVYDLRSPLSTTTLTIGSATDLVDLASLSLTRSVEDCFQRVVVRGGPEIVATLVGLRPPTNAPGTVLDNGLEERFGHDGLSNDDAKEVWSLNDFVTPGQVSGQATANPSMGTGGTAGKVVALVAGSKGYGYTPSATYHAVISAPSAGVTAAANSVADAGGQLATWTVTNAGDRIIGHHARIRRRIKNLCDEHL
jgi:hypothetical protein